jgi:hypothetical protein
MPAYLCESCDEAYPKSRDFDDCPICGTSTVFKNAMDPTVSVTEGMSRKRHAANLEAFAKWCKDNGRGETDLPPEAALFLPKGYRRADVVLAQRVRVLLQEQLLAQQAEIHVVFRLEG